MCSCHHSCCCHNGGGFTAFMAFLVVLGLLVTPRHDASQATPQPTAGTSITDSAPGQTAHQTGR